MKTQLFRLFGSLVFFTVLTSGLKNKDDSVLQLTPLQFSITHEGKECPIINCKENCALKKLAHENCPRCYCGEESRALLEEECRSIHGGCEPISRCPNGPQNLYLCGCGFTCCFYE